LAFQELAGAKADERDAALGPGLSGWHRDGQLVAVGRVGFGLYCRRAMMTGAVSLAVMPERRRRVQIPPALKVIGHVSRRKRLAEGPRSVPDRTTVARAMRVVSTGAAMKHSPPGRPIV
jgi:hypothetical protein